MSIETGNVLSSAINIRIAAKSHKEKANFSSQSLGHDFTPPLSDLARLPSRMRLSSPPVLQGNETLSHFTTVADTTILTTGNAAMTWDFKAPDWAAPMINLPPKNDSWDSHEVRGVRLSNNTLGAAL